MTIENFKELTFEEKLQQLKHHGELLGSYDRTVEPYLPKEPGDSFALFEFWVYLSDDEKTVIPTRRNPIQS